MLRIALAVLLVAGCGKKDAGPDAVVTAAPAPATPPPTPTMVAPPAEPVFAPARDAAAPAPAACAAEGAWTVKPELQGEEPSADQQCNAAPAELRYKVAAGGKVKVDSPKKWKVELERAEGPACAFELRAHGPVKGSVEGGFLLTLEPSGDGFAGKGSWAEDEGACPREATAKATRK